MYVTNLAQDLPVEIQVQHELLALVCIDAIEADLLLLDLQAVVLWER